MINMTAKQLPNAVISDEKAVAQTAGILYGKHALSPKSLTVWGAVSTVLVQATIKSAVNIPDAAKEAFDKRYLADIKDFANTNWYDIDEKKQATQRLGSLLNNAKVPITTAEIKNIIDEVQSHPTELRESLVNIARSIMTLQSSVH